MLGLRVRIRVRVSVSATSDIGALCRFTTIEPT